MTPSSFDTAFPCRRDLGQMTGVLRRLAALTAPRATKVTFCVRGVISPILANVYLHYVFDLWVHRWRRTKATGDVIVVRYADDTIVGFEHEHEARAFLQE